MQQIIPHIRLDPPLCAALQDIARTDATSVDAIVTAAIERELERRRRKQDALLRNRLAAIFPQLSGKNGLVLS